MQLRNKITIPSAVIGLMLLILGVSGGSYVLRLQRLNSQILDVNVSSIARRKRWKSSSGNASRTRPLPAHRRSRPSRRGIGEGTRCGSLAGAGPYAVGVGARRSSCGGDPRGLDEFFARLGRSTTRQVNLPRRASWKDLVDDILTAQVWGLPMSTWT